MKNTSLVEKIKRLVIGVVHLVSIKKCNAMKRDIFLTSILLFLVISSASSVFAQRGGRGPGGFDPDEMIKREKQNVYSAINDLSDDQKLLLDGIYDEYSVSFKELRDEMRKTRDFQAMRPKMVALRNEKEGLIKDVLNEDQFQIYLGLMEKRRRQMQENRQRRGEGGNPPEDLPSPDETPPQDQSN